MADENDQTVDGETAPETEVEDTEVAATEPELDDDGNPVEQDDAEAEPEDDEEVEVDGAKYRIPKALKSALMMQADYTRKTQELAEQRRELTQAQQLAGQQSEAVVQAKAVVVAIDARLGEYESYDWDAWEQRVQQLQQAGRSDEAQQDALALQAAYRTHQRLKEARQEALNAAETTTRETVERQREAHAKLIDEGQAVLKRDIPEWSPALATKLVEFGAKTFGFDPQELAGIADPRMVKVLHTAFKAAQGETKAKAAQKLAATQSIKPVTKVNAVTAPAMKDPDRMNADEWRRWRDAQVRKNNRA